MKKAICLLLFCITISYAIAAHGICLAQEELELAHCPQGAPIEVDSNPCGKLEVTYNIRFLGKNIIAYFSFYKGQIDFVRVRLTCEYKEKHMPPGRQPSLSKKRFQKILKILNRKRNFGKKLRSDTTWTSFHVSTYTDVYENAWVSWTENDCQEVSDFGCGIKRIDIGYIEQGK